MSIAESKNDTSFSVVIDIKSSAKTDGDISMEVLKERDRNISDQEHEYMMLSRYQRDCEYFLGHGGRSLRVLYYSSIDEQISEMKKVYRSLAVKPDWISMEDILEYEAKMKMEDIQE